MSPKLTPEDGAGLLALARAAIEDRLFGNDALALAQATVGPTAALAVPRMCFVTLKLLGTDGRLALRGCIGSTEADLPLREAVVASALDAAFADPRFPELTHDEYSEIVVSVSALTPWVQVEGADGIVVGRDGVALECDGRSAIFLPEVGNEQGWSRIELLEHLTIKAGLPAESWRRATLFTFESERFGETAVEAARIRRS